MSVSTSSEKKWGYAEYASIPEDLLRHEIIDGVHFVNPAPSTYHQTVSRRLQFQLYTRIELRDLGVVFNAPVDLQLSDHDIVQPDLLVILKSRPSIVTPTKINGVPDLVVEILSPSSIENDWQRKKQLFEKQAVPEYWIVDPFEQRLHQFVLVECQYVELPQSSEVRFKGLPDVVVDLTRVW